MTRPTRRPFARRSPGQNAVRANQRLLRDCELPHIAREAFVVKYPRGQDHFPHTNWRTGGGSSPRLETCPNWKNSSALVGDIYEASLNPTLWPGVFGRWAPGGSPIDRRAAVKFFDIIKVPPKPGFCAVLATRHGVTDENTFSHHSA